MEAAEKSEYTLQAPDSPSSLLPALQIAAQRRDDGYRVGADNDGHTLVLAIDGGGMAGSTNGGMVYELIERGLFHQFDRVTAISAGAIIGAAALSGQYYQINNVFSEVLPEAGFIDYKRALKRGEPIVKLAILENYLRENFVTEPIFDNPIGFSFGVTNLSEFKPMTVRAEDLRSGDPETDRHELIDWMMIGAHLPMVADHAVRKNGDLWCDGGVSIVSTEMLAMREGATDILTLKNRPVRPWEVNRRDVWLVGKWLKREMQRYKIDGPDVEAEFNTFSLRQKQHIGILRKGDYAPEVNVSVASPPEVSGLPGALTMDKAKLNLGFRIGRWVINEALNPGTEPVPSMPEKQRKVLFVPVPSFSFGNSTHRS